MIDLHFHLLPGMDDVRAISRPPTLARAAAAAGTDTIVATPHVSWEWRTPVKPSRKAFCASARILQICPFLSRFSPAPKYADARD